MPTITLAQARNRATSELTNFSERTGMRKTAFAALRESLKTQTTEKAYDIFLSHAVMDSDAILGVKKILEDHGYSVYIDWIEDPDLDRTNVTPQTAEKLRSRMNICKSLFYTTTDNHSKSKWMPWECGYFDGKKNRTAILPVTSVGLEGYAGQEYLGIYPYITEDVSDLNNRKMLWVRRSPTVYTSYDYWLQGGEPTQH